MQPCACWARIVSITMGVGMESSVRPPKAQAVSRYESGATLLASRRVRRKSLIWRPGDAARRDNGRMQMKRPKGTDASTPDVGGQYVDRTPPHDVELEHLVDRDVVSEPASDDDSGDTARLPAATDAREGMTVVEKPLGHAVGQWIFVVRCDCGRRWFDLKVVDSAQCPRCGLWVRVEVDPRGEG